MHAALPVRAVGRPGGAGRRRAARIFSAGASGRHAGLSARLAGAFAGLCDRHDRPGRCAVRRADSRASTCWCTSAIFPTPRPTFAEQTGHSWTSAVAASGQDGRRRPAGAGPHQSAGHRGRSDRPGRRPGRSFPRPIWATTGWWWSFKVRPRHADRAGVIAAQASRHRLNSISNAKMAADRNTVAKTAKNVAGVFIPSQGQANETSVIGGSVAHHAIAQLAPVATSDAPTPHTKRSRISGFIISSSEQRRTGATCRPPEPHYSPKVRYFGGRTKSASSSLPTSIDGMFTSTRCSRPVVPSIHWPPPFCGVDLPVAAGGDVPQGPAPRTASQEAVRSQLCRPSRRAL